MIQPRTLKGFRDYLPEAMIPRERLIDAARRVYRSYGFSPIDTPALEYLEILAGKGSEETDKQLYKFQDHGKRWVGLRFDLTVPLARFAAQHVAELGVLKRYPRHGLRLKHAGPLPRVRAVRFRHHRHPLGCRDVETGS
jgi:histidyl-tRNA synthetase